jgi:hypothetical protein
VEYQGGGCLAGDDTRLGRGELVAVAGLVSMRLGVLPSRSLVCIEFICIDRCWWCVFV